MTTTDECPMCSAPSNNGTQHSIICAMADLMPLPFSPHHPSISVCANRVLNGPLSDPALLIQIPAVRELAIEFVNAPLNAGDLGGDDDVVRLAARWLRALEANR